MKPLTIHPVSAPLDAVFCAVMLVGIGAVQVPNSTLKVYRPGTTPPADLVVIREGTLYLVPTGKKLVSTAFGGAFPTIASVELQIDGVPEIRSHTETATTLREVPRWLVVQPAATIRRT